MFIWSAAAVPATEHLPLPLVPPSTVKKKKQNPPSLTAQSKKIHSDPPPSCGEQQFINPIPTSAILLFFAANLCIILC